jgi:amino acid transporter
MPAIFILFAGVFKQMFFPELSLGWQIAIGVILTWLAVAVNIVALDVGKWIPNLGAILKVIIFLAIIAGAFVYVQDHGMANPLTFETLKPDWGNSLQYIPAIIYGMLAAIPAGDINLVEGLIDTLHLFFGGSAVGKLFVLALGIGALFTFFSNGVTWALGCNRAAAEAAMEGELPRIFALESKKLGTPIGAAVLMGLVSTVVLVLYGFLSGSNEDLFWSLFAFSAVIFLLPYEGMLLTFVKMRITDPDHPRPYRVPGGLGAARAAA